MKVRIAICVIAALLVFSGASPWEGAAAVAPAGELPVTGRFIATHIFPVNTIVDITNVENNRRVRVIVAKNLNSPGLVAIVSREAAELIGMRPGSASRVIMVQPSDRTAYQRFTEDFNTGIPEYDSENALSEEELFDDLYGTRPSGNNGRNQTAQADGLRGRSYIPDRPEWSGPEIIDLPGFDKYPPLNGPENGTQPTPVDEPSKADESSKPTDETTGREPPPSNEQPQREVIKEPSVYITEGQREEAEKAASEYLTEGQREEAEKAASEYLTEREREEAEKAASEYLTEGQRGEAEKAASEYLTEREREEAEKAASEYLTEREREEAEKAASEYLAEGQRGEAEKAASEYLTEREREEAEKAASEYLTEGQRGEAEKAASEYLTERQREEAEKDPSPYPPSNGQTYDPRPTTPRPPIIFLDPELPSARETTRPADPVAADAAFPIPPLHYLDRGWYYVQIASVDSLESVENIVRQVDSRYEPKLYRDSNNRFCILLRPMNQGESAAVLQRFKSIGFRDAFVRRGS